MSIRIALAGNPNCGKTTLFNILTGSNQYVGNWPGVTVEKKEGALKGYEDVIIQDLPGIYSLSPYSPEELVTRQYLVNDHPDAILNIVDGTNIERNLYLTTQLMDLGHPVIIAVNMIDLVRKRGDTIDLEKMSKALGCVCLEISALKSEGCMEAAAKAVELARNHTHRERPHVFGGSVEHALAHIEESIEGKVDGNYLRWYAIKLFERDERFGRKWPWARNCCPIWKSISPTAKRKWMTMRNLLSPTSDISTSKPLSSGQCLRRLPSMP